MEDGLEKHCLLWYPIRGRNDGRTAARIGEKVCGILVESRGRKAGDRAVLDRLAPERQDGAYGW